MIAQVTSQLLTILVGGLVSAVGAWKLATNLLVAQVTLPQVTVDTTWSPMGVAYVLTILIGGIVSIIGAWKLAKIEAHVNSEKTALHEQSISKDKEISILMDRLADQKTIATLLAQSTATSRAAREQQPPVAVTVASPITGTADNPISVEVINDATSPVPVDTVKKGKV